MNPITITAQALRQAANIQEQIQVLQAELAQILGGQVATSAGELPPARAEKKRTISAAGRAAMSAAARARWAGTKGNAPKRKLSETGIANIRAGVAKRTAARKASQPAAKPAPRRKVSDAGRARLSALTKARWAKAKKEGKARL
ncbi:MAG: hypothetical protein WCQ21_20185 [Verrucomicrobiota bacterium]